MRVGVKGFVQGAGDNLPREFPLRRKGTFLSKIILQCLQILRDVFLVEFERLAVKLWVGVELYGWVHLPDVVKHLGVFEQRVILVDHIRECRVYDPPLTPCDLFCEPETLCRPHVPFDNPTVVFVKLPDPRQPSLCFLQVGAEVEPGLPSFFVTEATLIPSNIRAVTPLGIRSEITVACRHERGPHGSLFAECGPS